MTNATTVLVAQLTAPRRNGLAYFMRRNPTLALGLIVMAVIVALAIIFSRHKRARRAG